LTTTQGPGYTRHFGDADVYLATNNIHTETFEGVWGDGGDWEWDAWGGVMTVLLSACADEKGKWREASVSDMLHRLSEIAALDNYGSTRLKVLALWWQGYGGIWPRGGSAVIGAGKMFGRSRWCISGHLRALESDPVFGRFLSRERKVAGCGGKRGRKDA